MDQTALLGMLDELERVGSHATPAFGADQFGVAAMVGRAWRCGYLDALADVTNRIQPPADDL